MPLLFLPFFTVCIVCSVVLVLNREGIHIKKQQIRFELNIKKKIFCPSSTVYYKWEKEDMVMLTNTHQTATEGHGQGLTL